METKINSYHGLFFVISIVLVGITGVGFLYWRESIKNGRLSISRSNLELIGHACDEYRTVNGVLPQYENDSRRSLWLLYPDFVFDGVFWNPRAEFPRPENASIFEDKDKRLVSSAYLESTGYMYFPECANTPNAILVAESKSIDGGRLVLRRDGSVSWLKDAELPDAIKENTH